MDDLEYRFVRGAGWVPGNMCEILTEEVGLYRITLEKRLPEMGEFWFHMDKNEVLQDVMQDMHNDYWSKVFASNHAEFNMSKWNGSRDAAADYCVVLLEKLCP